MSPLQSGDIYVSATKNKNKMEGWIRSILVDETSRNLLAFFILNFSFAFVELLYGMWTNCLGLISDAFHMFFDCTALLAGIIATVISRWSVDEAFSYGYVRAEILTGFVNSLFLFFIAISIFTEAIERLFEPPVVLQERIFVVAAVGLIVNIIGILAFRHGHSHHKGTESVAEKSDHSSWNLDRLNFSNHGHSYKSLNQVSDDSGCSLIFLGRSNSDQGQRRLIQSSNNQRLSSSDPCYRYLEHGHSHSDQKYSFSKLTSQSPHTEIIHGVFLHILADALGSIGVIFSTVLIDQFGWMIADPICSMFISVLIVISAIPLLSESAEILMQRTPHALEHVLPGCYQKVNNLDGVCSVRESHFWTLCTNVYVGNIRLEVTKDADSHNILSQTQNIFTRAGVKQLFVHIEIAST